MLTTKGELKVYPGKVVCDVIDDNMEWEPADLTDSPLGRLLLAAEKGREGGSERGDTGRRSE
jgi:hypothetical protein